MQPVMSNPRLRRLSKDHQTIVYRFSGHPHVKVEALEGQPPERYRVEFRLPGLVRDDRTAKIAEHHVCEIELSSTYPREPPRVLARTPLFHPNVVGHYCFADYWAPSQPLADVIEKVGDMIQWRVFSIESALDPVAAGYGQEHPDIFPIGDIELGTPELEISLGAG